VLYLGESIEVNRDWEDRQDPPSQGNRCSVHPHHHLPPHLPVRNDKDDHLHLILSDVVMLHDSIRAPGPIRCHPILINPGSEDPEVSNCPRKGRREQLDRRGITLENQTRLTELSWRSWMIEETRGPNATFFRIVSTTSQIFYISIFDAAHVYWIFYDTGGIDRNVRKHILQSCFHERIMIVFKKYQWWIIPCLL